MSEPVVVTVILKPVPDASGAASMVHAFGLLKHWAETHNVSVQPPESTDTTSMRFAALLAADEEHADSLIANIMGEAFVDTSYRKPADDLP